MSKKVIISLVFVAVLICALFATIKYIESTTEKTVSDVLTQQGINYKTVKHNFMESTLTIQGAVMKIAFLSDSVFTIDEIVVHEPNADALDAHVPERPLVAKEIQLHNIELAYKVNDIIQKVTVKNVTIGNWKQNLGRLALTINKEYNEAFFKALFDISVDSVKYSEIHDTGKLVVGHTPFMYTSKIKNIAINNIESTKIGSYVIEGADYTLDNNAGVAFINHVGKFEWSSIQLPPQDFWVFAAEIFPNALKGTLTEAQKMRLMTHIQAITNIFTNTKFELENVSLKQQDGSVTQDLVVLQGAHVQTEFDLANYTKANLTTSITGLNIDVKHLDFNRKEEELVTQFVGKIIPVDASFSLQLATNNMPSSLDIVLGVQNAGHSTNQIKVILPDEVLPRMFALGKSQAFDISEKEIQAWLFNTLLVSAETSYKDSGLLPKALIFASTENKKSVETTWEFISQQVSFLARKQLAGFGEKNIEALVACLHNPGELKIIAAPAQPMNLELLSAAFLLNPKNLNVSAVCTPGKSIVASANAVLQSQKSMVQGQSSTTKKTASNKQSSLNVDAPPTSNKSSASSTASAVTPEVTPEVAPKVAPEVVPEVAPQVASEVTPDANTAAAKVEPVKVTPSTEPTKAAKVAEVPVAPAVPAISEVSEVSEATETPVASAKSEQAEDVASQTGAKNTTAPNISPNVTPDTDSDVKPEVTPNTAPDAHTAVEKVEKQPISDAKAESVITQAPALPASQEEKTASTSDVVSKEAESKALEVPAAPAEPVEPAGPVESTPSTAPTAATEPTKTAKTAEVPAVSAEPVEPVTSTEATKAAEIPVVPAVSKASDISETPEKPAEPVKPEQAENVPTQTSGDAASEAQAVQAQEVAQQPQANLPAQPSAQQEKLSTPVVKETTPSIEAKTIETALTAPQPKKPGKALIVPSTEDAMGLTSFGADSQPDSCVEVIAKGQSPLKAVRLESMGAAIASWKTRDVKIQALGVLAVKQDGKVINDNDASFTLDVAQETPLTLCVQDNGAFTDTKIRLRVIFYHEDGSRTYSVVGR